MWSSPVAATLHMRTAAYPLARLGDLLEAIATGQASAAMMSEARGLEDRFGLPPASRRRVGVLVDWNTAAVLTAALGVFLLIVAA